MSPAALGSEPPLRDDDDRASPDADGPRADGHHHHHHGHSHGPAPEDFSMAFALGVGLNLALVVAQVAGGLVAHSLALIADAGHNFADVVGLVLAWWTNWLRRSAPTAKRTYGLR